MERYILARLLLAGFILFVVIFIIIRIAGGSDEPEMPDLSQDTEIVLSDMASSSGSNVQFIKTGPIVAAEDHRELRFTISRNRRVLQVMKGYNGEIEKQISLPNTEESYEAFLFAIENEGFTEAKENPTETDSRGVCSRGRVYTYRVRIGGSNRTDLWSTNCSNKQGTFDGNRSRIVTLFEKQFPNFSEFTRDVRY